MDIRYPAIVEAQADGGFFVQFVDFPDTFTEGETRVEAILNAAEALSGMLAWRLDAKVDIPFPSPMADGLHCIAPDAKTRDALLARLARR